MAKNFNKEIRKIDELIANTQLYVDKEKFEEKKQWIIQFYKDYLYDGDIEQRANEILEKALKGWNKASDSFDSRVEALIGHRTIATAFLRKQQVIEMRAKGYSDKEILVFFKNPRRNKAFKKMSDEIDKKKAALEFAPKVDGIPVLSNSIIMYLNQDEQLFWKQREVDYRREFEFNDSSDKVLLDEVLYNEVLLRRIKVVNLTGENKDSIKNLREPDLLQNHQRLLEKLGILRVQRIELNQDIEGNVSELSLALETKFKEIGKITDKKVLKKVLDKINMDYKLITLEEVEEIVEEQTLLREVEKMGELNVIPQAVFSQVESELEKKKIKIPDITADMDLGEIQVEIPSYPVMEDDDGN